MLWALGVIGDLLAAQRVMTQKTFERVRRIELQLGSRRRTTSRAPVPVRDARPARRATRAAREPRRRSTRRRDCERGVTVSEDGVVTGNTYDKYGSTNPLVRRLMARLRARRWTSC